jgi:hypothetical protein
LPSIIAGETAPDDYAVFDDGKPVGRIRRATERRGEVGVWNQTVNVPGVANGAADSLEAAKAAFRESWLASKARITPEQLARALAETRGSPRILTLTTDPSPPETRHPAPAP